MKTTNNLRVRIQAAAMERIWHWTGLASGEFSCLGTVDGLDINDVQLFDQTCSAASTEMDQSALAQFLCSHPRPEAVRAWVHSHGKLGVFWSDQDDACIEGLANDTCLISVVVNKARQLKCRIDLWQPLRVTLHDIPVDVVVPDYDLAEQCRLEFERHVTEMPVVTTVSNGRWTPLTQSAPSNSKQRPSPVDWSMYDDFSDWR